MTGLVEVQQIAARDRWRYEYLLTEARIYLEYLFDTGSGSPGFPIIAAAHERIREQHVGRC